MTDEYRTYARFLIEISLKRENAEPQIDRARHSFDAARITSPNLRANLVNYPLLWRLLLHRTGQSQIESRIIDQHDSVWFTLQQFLERFATLVSELTVLPTLFPQTKNSSVAV